MVGYGVRLRGPLISYLIRRKNVCIRKGVKRQVIKSDLKQAFFSSSKLYFSPKQDLKELIKEELILRNVYLQME